ncbi:hypothetical protein PHYBLDRAFT_141823 [Phycomyces blakesleeanus NRRL 1555(-)]|uniref:Uncharacterized protein n=1 Tax=Phycomyces blakesleeanus (strain ATCC 8743b / DSM 1359 / FGSC 10004 / NBRC 33097 / NRRL 1555) TaxID=763407 RepID=A0A162UTN4_PHYB8|nr:hypothetical protein PHYBLDRAFT_141823 [Phycomyces blakesleeanus NRRL 1555(-)]OAD77962.1 hypothetical protein PHYBLDRAFT_141823 [Phycomyces blakesleeanus NRRL 1555(-)]|eukprot:XP_018296002.1 hypothetical protein PHYBLDRAFT_141823 [Phycomyces blakesleeanus NRRL 1555(-)]
MSVVQKIRNPTMVEIVMKNEQETLKYVNGGIKFEDKNAYGFPSFGSDCNTPEHICNRFPKNRYILRLPKYSLSSNSENENDSKDPFKKANIFTTPTPFYDLKYHTLLHCSGLLTFPPTPFPGNPNGIVPYYRSIFLFNP